MPNDMVPYRRRDPEPEDDGDRSRGRQVLFFDYLTVLFHVLSGNHDKAKEHHRKHIEDHPDKYYFLD